MVQSAIPKGKQKIDPGIIKNVRRIHVKSIPAKYTDPTPVPPPVPTVVVLTTKVRGLQYREEPPGTGEWVLELDCDPQGQDAEYFGRISFPTTPPQHFTFKFKCYAAGGRPDIFELRAQQDYNNAGEKHSPIEP